MTEDRNSFDVVVAADEAGGIGRSGQLPWHLPGDMKHFVKLTRDTGDPDRQNAVIMGRVTWESIPERFRPLAGRLNAVLSRRADLVIAGAEVYAQLDQAIAAVASRVERVFVIGGAQIYRQALAMGGCRRVYLTRVAGTFDCDAFLPELQPTFARHEILGAGQDDGVRYQFELWTRSR